MKLKKFALFGNPVEHSLSPKIYKELFEKNKVEGSYESISACTVREMVGKSEGLDGFNITYPLKTLSFTCDICDETDEYSKISKSLNTIIRRDGKLYGYNTDGIGFAKTIKEKNQKILIIGSGATAKVSAIALKKDGHNVVMVVRTKIENNYFKKQGIIVVLSSDILVDNYDIIVNMTSAGLENNELPLKKEILEELIKLSSRGIDINYAKKTPFLVLFDKYDKEYENGLKMLRSQAKENIKLFKKGEV